MKGEGCLLICEDGPRERGKGGGSKQERASRVRGEREKKRLREEKKVIRE